MSRRVGIPGRADGRVLNTGGVSRSGSTTDAHLAVWNGSNADSIKDGGAPGSGGASTADHFIVGKGGDGDTDLTNKVIIPGFSSHPDIRVAGTNDDEFDTTSTFSSTVGTLDTNNVTDFLSCLHLARTVTAQAVNGVYKACPTIPFTMSAKLNDMYFVGNLGYPRAGIFIAEATPGKIEGLGLIFLASSWSVEWTAWSSPTSNSDYNRPGTYMPPQLPIYLRIVVHSSTNVDYEVSHGGYDYKLVYNGAPFSARNPGFTVGACGLFVDGINNGTLSKAVFDWVRFT